jgi:hypothetical protein
MARHCDYDRRFRPDTATVNAIAAGSQHKTIKSISHRTAVSASVPTMTARYWTGPAAASTRCFGSQGRALGLHLNQRCAGQPDGRNKRNGVAEGAGSLAERRNGFRRNRRAEMVGNAVGVSWRSSARSVARRVEQQRPVNRRFKKQIFHRGIHLVQLSVDMMRAASRA